MERSTGCPRDAQPTLAAVIMARSACGARPLTTALAEWLAALVSGGVEPVSEAVLVNVPALVASAVSARAYPLPTANDGMVQTPLFGLKLVMPGTPALLKLRPGGNTSNTVMLEAELGPRLVMVMVKGTRPPTKTELVPTVLVTCKSTRGCATVTTTPEELLAGFGSETLADRKSTRLN